MAIQELLREDESYTKLLHPKFATVVGEIVWAVRNEMARTIDDFLSRRTRMLLLNAKASLEAAPTVARIMAKELDEDIEWENVQINSYNQIAHNYLISE